jgi:Fe-S-cluster containining protein
MKGGEETLSAEINLAGEGWRLSTTITVPAGKTTMREVLPTFQLLANASVAQGEEASRAEGLPMSCKKGCAACCRQFIPINQGETRLLADLVDALPEPKRSVVRERFAEARRRVEAAGLMDQLNAFETWQDEEAEAFGLKYFRLGIACPFLEDEACSIYEDRPLICREYLVTSPAENCSRPSADTIRMLKLPLNVWMAVARSQREPDSKESLPLVPLILLLEWTAAHPSETATLSGPQWVSEVFRHLTGKTIPPPSESGGS